MIMRFLVLLLVLVLPIASIADVPERIKRDAAKNASRAILDQCKKSDDLKECLIARGFQCEPEEGQKEQQHHCSKDITVDFTKAGRRDKPPELVEKYRIQITVYMTKKGWRGKTGPSTLVSAED